MVDLTSRAVPDLPLPPALEAYRNLVFATIYGNTESIRQTLCWSSYEVGLNEHLHSRTVLFPGEERFSRRSARTVDLSGLGGPAVECPWVRKTSSLVVDPREYTVTGLAGITNAAVKAMHECRLHPTQERPLLCRLWPFVVEPMSVGAGENTALHSRKARVLCLSEHFEALTCRLGTNRLDQIAYDTAVVFSALWSFLSDDWWRLYHRSMRIDPVGLRPLLEFDVQVDEDTIFSRIRGASEEWRTPMLKALCDPDCFFCNDGIELVTPPGYRTKDGMPCNMNPAHPVVKPYYDICRHCVAKAIGARIGDNLIDRHSGKVLDNLGREYRGDYARDVK